MGNGVERTAEGLGKEGMNRIEEIGLENRLIANMFVKILIKLVELDLASALNPFFQIITKTISNLLGELDEKQLIDLLQTGLGKIDSDLVRQVIKNKVIDIVTISEEEINLSLSRLNSRVNHREQIAKVVGWYHGGKLANYIAVTIAVSIAKAIAVTISKHYSIKISMQNIRNEVKRGGRGAVLLYLVKLQGTLQNASNASKELHSMCPNFWLDLRNKHNGLDLLYFTIKEPIKPYIILLSLARKGDPQFKFWAKSVNNIDDLILI